MIFEEFRNTDKECDIIYVVPDFLDSLKAIVNLSIELKEKFKEADWDWPPHMDTLDPISDSQVSPLAPL